MAAGHATSADTLTWSLYTMATNQEIQKQVRDEIADLAIRKPDMPFSDIDNLPYLNNFIKEVLRLYAPCESYAI